MEIHGVSTFATQVCGLTAAVASLGAGQAIRLHPRATESDFAFLHDDPKVILIHWFRPMIPNPDCGIESPVSLEKILMPMPHSKGIPLESLGYGV